MTGTKAEGSALQSRPSAVRQLRPDPALESRGRLWLFGSFLLCPCHMPLTLGILATVLGGTGLAATVRDNAVFVGVSITVLWLVGTAYGFRLLARARSGAACSRT